ncbi:prepilin peptidase [Tuwongella immobilis]|uniref:Prepilin peptidase A24 N-terminal domain-containing protein n=1 Tax=Tuwongella immobilis TaxID=692036 RepID=A0A6C2YPX2_9BACT
MLELVTPVPLMAMWMACVFLIGLAVGSGLNVFIFRIPNRCSVLWPSSHCFHCFQKIRWHDNIPILGYWLLRGKCRKCKAPFSASYFGVEIGTGVLFLAAFYVLVVMNWMRFPMIQSIRPLFLLGAIPVEIWLWFLVIAILIAFSIIVFQISRMQRPIPASIGVTACVMVAGFTLAYPWPWPNAETDVLVNLNRQSQGLNDVMPGLQLAPWKPAYRYEQRTLLTSNPTVPIVTLPKLGIPDGIITLLLGGGFMIVGIRILGLLRIDRIVEFDTGMRLILIAWGGLFGWQAATLLLLLVSLVPIAAGKRVALLPWVVLIAWPWVGRLFRMIGLV